MDQVPIKAIIKNGTRVFTPKEYDQLKEKLTPDYVCICDILLYTGMRMPELIKFKDNPDWYDPHRRCIELPQKAILKKKTVYKTRQITLTIGGCEAVEHFQKMIKDNMHIPSRQAMLGTLRRAAIDAQIPEGDKGVVPKAFRKTIVSWLMKAYPNMIFEIAGNMGHTLQVMQRNYTNLAFAPEDLKDIKVRVKGWGFE